jgi:hypothetical protein
MDTSHPSGWLPDPISATVGLGLWLALGGGIAALIGGLLALSRGPDIARRSLQEFDGAERVIFGRRSHQTRQAP